MLTPPTYHMTSEPAFDGGRRPVLVKRHALPPFDVVDRVAFEDAAKMREVGEALIEFADALDAIERTS